MISFTVRGTPIAQGNMSAVKGRVFHQKRPELEAWRHAIATAASLAMGASPVLATPLAVIVSFRLQRPKGHTGKRGLLPSAPRHPAGKPDADKLLRSTLDAMTGVVYADDSQVCRIVIEKCWADEVGPGAAITVEELA